MDNERIISDFLVSKTDTNGKIIYCNEEFIKISGYTEKELLGKPHNIVRHPDMPKTIFKYLWQRVSKGNEVNAYVKNLAKDGSYYWVFANVAPSFSNDGKRIIAYNSVRRKPNKEGLSFIKDFYQELKREEQKGLDTSMQWFKEYFEKQRSKYENAILCLQESTMCLPNKL